jgi:glycosyltransferase involved in cell wall biosynthesis
MKPVAILVSPTGLDGYPPVQHQARLLAAAGFKVEIITSPLAWGDGAVSFSGDGVSVHAKTLRKTNKVGAVQRAMDFVATLAMLRRQHGSGHLIEIAYEPLGMLYSDVAPFRPEIRIAHFHELLVSPGTIWLESRLRRAIRGYQLTVVPDPGRAASIAGKLGLTVQPTVVPNFPMAAGIEPAPACRASREFFEVIYCGSVGPTQKLDIIGASVASWPQQAVFTILGNDLSQYAQELRQRALAARLGDRVRFEGWIAFDALPQRLAEADLAISLLDPAYELWRTALGASNKRYQYMQAGLAQIGDMNPGVAEMLEGRGIGRCVREHTPEAIAAVVWEYAADPERCRREGEKARALHLAEFNYERAFQPVLAWIEAALARQTSRLSQGWLARRSA